MRAPSWRSRRTCGLQLNYSMRTSRWSCTIISQRKFEQSVSQSLRKEGVAGYPVCDGTPSIMDGPRPSESEELVTLGVAGLPTDDAIVVIGRSPKPRTLTPAIA
jgi:hypothetical protein